jgi:hypothetical protein
MRIWSNSAGIMAEILQSWTIAILLVIPTMTIGIIFAVIVLKILDKVIDRWF